MRFFLREKKTFFEGRTLREKTKEKREKTERVFGENRERFWGKAVKERNRQREV